MYMNKETGTRVFLSVGLVRVKSKSSHKTGQRGNPEKKLLKQTMDY